MVYESTTVSIGGPIWGFSRRSEQPTQPVTHTEAVTIASRYVSRRWGGLKTDPASHSYHGGNDFRKPQTISTIVETPNGSRETFRRWEKCLAGSENHFHHGGNPARFPQSVSTMGGMPNGFQKSFPPWEKCSAVSENRSDDGGNDKTVPENRFPGVPSGIGHKFPTFPPTSLISRNLEQINPPACESDVQRGVRRGDVLVPCKKKGYRIQGTRTSPLRIKPQAQPRFFTSPARKRSGQPCPAAEWPTQVLLASGTFPHWKSLRCSTEESFPKRFRRASG